MIDLKLNFLSQRLDRSKNEKELIVLLRLYKSLKTIFELHLHFLKSIKNILSKRYHYITLLFIYLQ